jgi:hypothetical protein
VRNEQIEGGTAKRADVRFVPKADIGLIDHLVGPYKQGRRDFETKRSGGSQVDHQIEPGRLHERQFANFFPL